MTNNGSSLPVACSLPPPELRERAESLRQELGALVEEIRELEDGVAFRLVRTEASLKAARGFVDFERGCCRFATCELSGDDEAKLWIRIRGPEGTKRIFAELLRGKPSGRTLG